MSIANFRIYFCSIKDGIYWAVLTRLRFCCISTIQQRKIISRHFFHQSEAKQDSILCCSKEISRAGSRLHLFSLITDFFLNWQITHSHNKRSSGCAIPKLLVHLGALKRAECLVFRQRVRTSSGRFRLCNAYSNRISAACLTLLSRMWRPSFKASSLISAYMTRFATNHLTWWRVASLPRGTFFYFRSRETLPRCYIGSKLVQRWKHKALTTLYTCLLIFLLRRRGWRGVPPSSGWESSRKTTKMSCNDIKWLYNVLLVHFLAQDNPRAQHSPKRFVGAENRKVSGFFVRRWPINP